jgi:hypothetical protein
MIFTSRPTSSPYALFYFTSADYLQFSDSTFGYIRTASVFRDPSAWYHILLNVDTTGATAADYLKIYVNNVRQTIGASTLPSQNSEGQINTATAHSIGSPQPYASTEYFNGYVAQAQFIDGQALTPSSFTEVSATTGQLIPKAYSGTYGTNGFYLKFADNSTTAALGTDSSGNGNTWTTNNFSVTAGAGNDSLLDTPTSYGTDTGVGGEVRGNYATLNPLKFGGDIQAPTNGNLDVTSVGSATGKILGTIGVSSGKWYWECVPNSSANIAFGITKDNTVLANYPGQDAVDYAYHNDGSKYNNNSGSAYGATYTTNDVIGVAFDADNGTLTFYKNNSSQGQAYSGLTSGPYFPLVGDPSSTPDISATANFGQRPFAYTAPSGFKALVDTNLPTPVVAKPNTLMDVALYTGNGSTQTISGLAFSPDLVWMKVRSTTYNHTLIDSVRGATKTLSSSMTVQEYTEPTGPTAFTADGWSMSGDVTYVGSVNASGQTYVGWAWDAGTSTVSNTQGSITSQVRANATAGFSVVTYTGTGSAATVGHGLGVAPHMIISKSRNNAGGDAGFWPIYHIGLTSASYFLKLNTTDAQVSASTVWNSTAPTSSVYSVGSASGTNAGSTATYVAYCFSPVVGYSSFGSYTGNGSADGPFVFCGFRPKWVLFKCSSTTSAWNLTDTTRQTYNVQQTWLQPNTSDAEYTGGSSEMDILSNGFKLRNSNSPFNTSSATYIYAAFAESPFQYARAR